MPRTRCVAGDCADPDGDLLFNIEEYAFNTDPLASKRHSQRHRLTRHDQRPAVPGDDFSACHGRH